MKSYAGVPHLKGDPQYNQALTKLVRSTRPGGEFGFGGFSSLFDLKKLGMKDPILVSTADGVGTKLELAKHQGKHGTIGIDLVAMCVNDLITCGAKPIFFLDYFAAGKFDQKRTVEVIRGIARGCRESGCALVGGETAIMPGFYSDSKYDLAGFAVGVVERNRVINGERVKAGDILLGLESSGFHSNGYSLLRKVFTKKELSGTIGGKLLIPTRIYVKSVLELIRNIDALAIAHITGGGFYDNLPRVLPKGLGVSIRKGSWPIPKLFAQVQKRAHYSEREMFRTFNMGIGMAVLIRASDAGRAQMILRRHRIRSWEIGAVVKGNGVRVV
jgi:phosphoribosylformylglycinamidine cyclo-ligase